MRQDKYAASTENGALQLEEFKKNPLAKTAMGELYLALIEEKFWSKDLSASVCFYKGDAFINIFSSAFETPGYIRFRESEEFSGTVEGVYRFFARSLLEKEYGVISQQKQLKERKSLLRKTWWELSRMRVLQVMAAKVKEGRVYPPKKGLGVWYAINGNRILAIDDFDPDQGPTVYALENMTREQFEKERLGLPFRSMVKGATKL